MEKKNAIEREEILRFLLDLEYFFSFYFSSSLFGSKKVDVGDEQSRFDYGEENWFSFELDQFGFGVYELL